MNSDGQLENLLCFVTFCQKFRKSERAMYGMLYLEVKIMNSKRKTTVTYRYQQRLYSSKKVPEIRMSGQWLKDLGFDTGKKLQITCEPEKLIIALQPDNDHRAMEHQS